MKPLVSLIFFLLIAAPASAETPFVFAFEGQELFPYYMGDTEVKKKNPGTAIETIKLLENYLPVKVSFIRLSWKRALIGLKTGKVDSVIASYKPGRIEFGIYPMKNGKPNQEKRLSRSNYYLYVMNTANITWHPKELRFTGVNSAIGAPFGYSIVALLRKSNVRVDEYGDATDNLVKLVAGRLDGAALLEFDTDHILFHKKDTFPGVVKLEPPLVSKPYYLMFSHQFHKKNTRLCEKIWETCVYIRKNHRKEILQRYLQMKK